MFKTVLGKVVHRSQLTSAETILLLLQLEKLNVQLIVLPDHPGIFCPVRLQESIDVSTLFLSVSC